MEPQIKVKQRVELIDKGWFGTVAYVGSTQFQPGKWVGVVLEEPLGKNNGTVQGKEYFKCQENFGLFVRPAQLKVVTREGSSSSSMTSSVDEKAAGTRLPHARKMRLPLSKDEASNPAAPSKLRAPKKIESEPVATSTSVESSAKSSPAASANTTDDRVNNNAARRRASVAVTRVQPSGAIDDGNTVAQQVARIEQDMDKSVIIEGVVKATNAALEALSDGARVEYLKSELKDCSEKLETLRLKRQEDKQKLIDYEKCKIHLQQLVEYKTKMAEVHSELQRQLQMAKKEAKESIEAREAYQEEMSGLAESVEMATLDKEVAEERAEMLQSEVETLKEKVHELEMDLELLRNEMEEKGSGAGVTNTVQLKQLEQQNERLKEAVVKMRDLSAHERREQQRATKELEALKVQVSDLSKKNEKLTVEIQQYEHQLAELKEQVDAALGSEEMVEQLTTQNLALEEKVLHLEETIEDFEQMRQMDEELQESTKELEKELRTNFEEAQSKLNEMKIQLKKSHDQVLDHEQTILKFRQLTCRYQNQIQDLKDRLYIVEDADEKRHEAGSIKLSSAVAYSQTKAWSEIVESEMRKLELENALQHVRYLRSFLPDDFAKPGGDNDSVMLTLFFPRLSAKVSLLISKLVDLYPLIPGGMRSEHVIKSHKAEQWSFVCLMKFCLSGLLVILHKFENVLNGCSVERLAKLAQLQPEILAQERLLDHYFELLKTNRLDENVSLENLDRLNSYFQNFYATHLSIEDIDCCQVAHNNMKQLTNGLIWLKHECTRARFYVAQDDMSQDLKAFFDDLELFVVEIEKNFVRLKTVIPQESKQRVMKFSSEVENLFKESNSYVEKCAKLLHKCCTVAGSRVSMIPDVESIESKMFEELLQSACHDLDDTNSNSMNYDDFSKILLGRLISTVIKLIELMEKSTYEDKDDKNAVFPPVLERAHARKLEAVEAESLKWQVDKKCDEVKDLKLALRRKAEEISEMKVRKELAESKLQTTGKEGDERVVRLQKTIEEMSGDAKKKETEFDKVMDTYQKDMENLEKENAELKDQVQKMTKRSLLQGIAAHGMYGSPPGKVQVQTGNLLAPSSDVSYLEQQLRELVAAYSRAHAEKCALQGARMNMVMKQLTPLNVPKKSSNSALTIDLDQVTLKKHGEINQISRESSKLVKEFLHNAAVCKVINLSKHRSDSVLARHAPFYAYNTHLETLHKLNDWISSLNFRMAKYKRHAVEGVSESVQFETLSAAHFCKQESDILVARVIVGKANDAQNRRVVRVNLEPSQLSLLHRVISA